MLAGVLCGEAIVAFLYLRHLDPLLGLNAGFVGLCANFMVVVAVSLLAPGRTNGFEKLFLESSSSRSEERPSEDLPQITE